jgi:hypothetical protein
VCRRCSCVPRGGGFTHDARKPGSYRVTDCGEIGAQAVVTVYQHHRAALGSGRKAEPISLPLHDERRHCHGIELEETALRRRCAGTARRPERECEAEHSDGAGRRSGAAGDPSAGRAPADDEREALQLACKQTLDHRRPRRIELMRRCRSTPSRNAVRLLDENDVQSSRVRDARDRNEVRRLHAATRAMAKQE